MVFGNLRAKVMLKLVFELGKRRIPPYINKHANRQAVSALSRMRYK